MAAENKRANLGSNRRGTQRKRLAGDGRKRARNGLQPGARSDAGPGTQSCATVGRVPSTALDVGRGTRGAIDGTAVAGRFCIRYFNNAGAGL